jgi:histidinol phosphatase-like PHP family hydrolase
MKSKVHKITNTAIAEWLALKAEEATGPNLPRALRHAARSAFLWELDAREVALSGESLQQLDSVGPSIERILLGWFAQPPPISPPPPLRQDFLSLMESRAILKRAELPAYHGDLQMHSRWSDGSASILEMARAGQARGYNYIGITDHSRGLKIAGGIDEDQFATQSKEIDGVNEALKSEGFRVLKSIEMNLNPQGEGDMQSEALAKLDLVVGSFHSRLRVKEDQTERYLAALRNPDVHILGHPRGRIYNYRIGLTADWSRVFREAAALDKAVEIDSYPDRQDLNVGLLKIARETGVRIAIDTDAHHPEQLGYMELGLAAAVRAKIPADRIVNFLPVEKLLAWVKALRKTSQTRRGKS